jgi:hypothetical protein
MESWLASARSSQRSRSPFPLHQADLERVGPHGLAGQLHPTLQQLLLVHDHPRLGADGHQRLQPPDLLALGHQRLGGALQHPRLAFGQVEAGGERGHHPGDRLGRVAAGLLLDGRHQRLQRGGVLALELPDGLLEVDAVEQG